MKANQPLVDLPGAIARRKKEIAIAWPLAQKPFIAPTPGTRKPARPEENLGAADVELAPQDLREIEAAVAKVAVRGARGTGHERCG